MASGKFTENARALIKARAKGVCERCGLTGATQIHHRRPRGMGGSKDPATHSPANGVYVHTSCHAWIESNRKRAAYLGYLVGYGRQPESAEIRLWDGWWLLTESGDRLPYAPDS